MVIQKGGVKGLNSRSQCRDAEEEKGLKELLETQLEKLAALQQGVHASESLQAGEGRLGLGKC